MPHWPTATTRRSPCVAALVGTARLTTRAPAPKACRNLRRFIGCNIQRLLPGRLLDGCPVAGNTERFTVEQGPREVKGGKPMTATVLIVEDEVLQARSIKRSLERHGYQVLMAATAESADYLRPPRVAPFFWMKSATLAWMRRPNSCTYSKPAASDA